MHASTPFNAPGPSTQPVRRRSTDAPTRVFHWLFALSFAGAYLTAESEQWRLLHVTLGYGFAGLLVWRLLYGFVGPRQVRLGLLWSKLSAAPVWFQTLRSGNGPWPALARQGSHIAMALAVLLMLALVLPLVLSGYATYNEWGGAWAEDALEEAHEFLGNAFLAIALGHVGLIAVLSVIRRQNMARPMLDGRLPGQGPSPVMHQRLALAMLMVMVWASFVAWHLQASAQDLPPAAVLSRPVGSVPLHAADDD